MLMPEELQRLMDEARRERAMVMGDLVARGWRRLWRALRAPRHGGAAGPWAVEPKGG
jgi:hypothetical protein